MEDQSHPVSGLSETKIEGSADTEEELWRLLVLLAPEGVFLEDVHGTILDVNEAGAAMFGYAREEMVGMSIADLVPDDLAEELPPEITATTGSRAVRRWNRRRDGTLFPTEIATRFVEFRGEKRLVAYVRDDAGYWRRVEEFVSHHASTRFSHGLCPECASELYPDLFQGMESGEATGG